MNPIALIHLLSGILIIAVSVPLIKRRVPMNRFYGFRLDEAYASEQKWHAINAYGGSLSLRWGILFVIAGIIGILLPPSFWLAYACASLFLFVITFAIIFVKVSRYARTGDGTGPKT